MPNLGMQTGTCDGTRYDAKPKGIAVAPDGKPWFVQAEAGNPGLPDRHDRRRRRLPRVPALPDGGAVLGRALRHGADRRGRGRGRHRLVHERAQEDDRPLRARRRHLRGVRLADIDPALGAGTPRALAHGAGRRALGRGHRRLLGPGRQRDPADRPGRLRRPSRPTSSAPRCSRSRSRPAPNGDVWFTGSAGDRRRADRPADRERPRSRRRRRRPRRPPRRRRRCDPDADSRHRVAVRRTSTSPSTTRSRSTSRRP